MPYVRRYVLQSGSMSSFPVCEAHDLVDGSDGGYANTEDDIGSPKKLVERDIASTDAMALYMREELQQFGPSRTQSVLHQIMPSLRPS